MKSGEGPLAPHKVEVHRGQKGHSVSNTSERSEVPLLVNSDILITSHELAMSISGCGLFGNSMVYFTAVFWSLER